MRILVIEDDNKIAAAIKKGLEQETYAVDVCENGKKGFALALNDGYDLIILDRLLPEGMDGIAICRALRDKKIHTPILMLTALDKIKDRVEGLNAGADDYLVKPFAFDELIARVKALLRRPAQHLGSILVVNDLTLDTLTFKVYRGKKEIKLSATEFKLLEYLMRNPNRILTKDKIIEHVWDYDADILPNTVEAYIGYLRQKIEKPFSGPELFLTVRGFGYKLEAKV